MDKPVMVCLAFILCLVYTTPLDTKASTRLTIPAKHKSAYEICSPHKGIYLMPVHYVKDITYPGYYDQFKRHRQEEGLKFNPYEVAYQWSGKLLCATWGKWAIYGAYAQESHWQFYIRDPYFRATDYQFEIFSDRALFVKGYTANLRVGYIHISNGLGLNILSTSKETSNRSPKQTINDNDQSVLDTLAESDSNIQKKNIEKWGVERGWDRIYASVKIDFKKYYVLLKLWHMINPSFKYGVGKYNADIGEFLGYGKLTFAYQFSHAHSITISKRLIDKRANYGLTWNKTWEIDYLFPICPAIQGIINGFSGYGRNMITYNQSTFGLGIGIILCFS